MMLGLALLPAHVLAEINAADKQAGLTYFEQHGHCGIRVSSRRQQLLKHACIEAQQRAAIRPPPPPAPPPSPPPLSSPAKDYSPSSPTPFSSSHSALSAPTVLHIPFSPVLTAKQLSESKRLPFKDALSLLHEVHQRRLPFNDHALLQRLVGNCIAAPRTDRSQGHNLSGCGLIRVPATGSETLRGAMKAFTSRVGLGKHFERPARYGNPPPACFVLGLREPADKLASFFRYYATRKCPDSPHCPRLPCNRGNPNACVRFEGVGFAGSRVHSIAEWLDILRNESNSEHADVKTAYVSSVGRATYTSTNQISPTDMALMSQLDWLQGLDCATATIFPMCTESLAASWQQLKRTYLVDDGPHDLPHKHARSRGKTPYEEQVNAASSLSSADRAFINLKLYPWDYALHRAACVKPIDAEAALSVEMRAKGADPMNTIKADPVRYMERAGATGQLAMRQLVAEEALRLVAELRSEMRAKVIIEEDIDDKIAAIHADPARYKSRAGATGELAQVLDKGKYS